MHSHELTGYLRKDWGINPANVMVADREYVRPAADWFYGEFALASGILFGQLGLRQFAPERNDCDDFARGAAWLSQVLHHRTSIERTALAVGEFWYFRKGNPEDEHAVNIAIDHNRKPMFMEPQNQQRIELTEAERISCTALRF